MPKRNSEDKIKRYKEKIKKLEEKQKLSSKRRSRTIVSDSESDIENEDIQIHPNNGNDDINYIYSDNILPIPDDVQTLNTLNVNEPPLPLPPTESDELTNNDIASSKIPQQDATNNAAEVTTEVPVELDPEIRLALGDPIEDNPKYGPNIHNDLVQRWLPILKKGLDKDVKEKLLKEQQVPENCKLLKSPCLNPEIAAAVAEVVRARDKKMEIKQNQLGLGITAISRAMELLITDGKKVDVIKLLSESCRILTDLHHTETQTRIKCITPCLDKSILNIIQEEERDEFLYGSKLSEKIKAAKAIEKQGWQIKRNVIPQKNNQHQVQSKVRQAGNWTPPPRYASSSNRGGRGAYMTSRAPLNRQFRPQALPPPAVQPQARSAAVPRQRAPTRQ